MGYIKNNSMKLRQRIYESSMTEKEAFIACKNLIVDALNTVRAS